MTRPALLLALLAALCAAASARAERDERDRSGRGALSAEELRREPVTFELDVPYADTGNPRHGSTSTSRSSARARCFPSSCTSTAARGGPATSPTAPAA